MRVTLNYTIFDDGIAEIYPKGHISNHNANIISTGHVFSDESGLSCENKSDLEILNRYF